MKTMTLIILSALFLAGSHAGETMSNLIAKPPIGKIAFVSGSFGSIGTISVVGEDIQPFQGGNPEFGAKSGRLIFSNNGEMGTRLFLKDLAANTTVAIEKELKILIRPHCLQTSRK